MGKRIVSVLSLLGVLLLGVTAGAMLTEATILLPYWQSLAPTDFFDWYAGEFDDHLMRRGSTPLWLQSFLVCEGLLQLPFFFVATRALLQRQCSERVRVMFIVYGAHVATTVVPILADLLSAEKPVLAAIYCPYFFVPLSLAMLFGAGNPFNKSAAKRR